MFRLFPDSYDVYMLMKESEKLTPKAYGEILAKRRKKKKKRRGRAK